MGLEKPAEFKYRKYTVPTVVSNDKYRSKFTGNSIQLSKLNSLFNLGQTQLRLIICNFNLIRVKAINEINNNRNLRLGSPHYYAIQNKN